MAEQTTLLPGGVQALSHPCGIVIYLRDGQPWIARGPADAMRPGEAFLRERRVDVRVDLRDGVLPIDRIPVVLDMETVRLPLPSFPQSGPDRDHSPAIVANAPALRAAIARVGAIMAAGRVPVVHCQAGADRTGAVMAGVLLPVVGADAVRAEHARASAHARHPRAAREIDAFLALLAPAG